MPGLSQPQSWHTDTVIYELYKYIVPGLSQLQSWHTDTVTYELYHYIMPGLSQLQSWHTDKVTYELYQLLCQGCLSSNRGTLTKSDKVTYKLYQYIMPRLSQPQSWHTDTVIYELYQYIVPGLSQLQSWHTHKVTYGLYQLLCQGCKMPSCSLFSFRWPKCQIGFQSIPISLSAMDSKSSGIPQQKIHLVHTYVVHVHVKVLTILTRFENTSCQRHLITWIFSHFPDVLHPMLGNRFQTSPRWPKCQIGFQSLLPLGSYSDFPVHTWSTTANWQHFDGKTPASPLRQTMQEPIVLVVIFHERFNHFQHCAPGGLNGNLLWHQTLVNSTNLVSHVTYTSYLVTKHGSRIPWEVSFAGLKFKTILKQLWNCNLKQFWNFITSFLQHRHTCMFFERHVRSGPTSATTPSIRHHRRWATSWPALHHPWWPSPRLPNKRLIQGQQSKWCQFTYQPALSHVTLLPIFNGSLKNANMVHLDPSVHKCLQRKENIRGRQLGEWSARPTLTCRCQWLPVADLHETFYGNEAWIPSEAPVWRTCRWRPWTEPVQGAASCCEGPTALRPKTVLVPWPKAVGWVARAVHWSKLVPKLPTRELHQTTDNTPPAAHHEFGSGSDQ